MRLCAVVLSSVCATGTFVIDAVPIAEAAGPTIVTGVVSDAMTGEPLLGVEVEAVRGSTITGASTPLAQATTNAAGVYSLDLTSLATSADAVTVDLVDPEGAHGVSMGNALSLVDGESTVASFALRAGGVVAGTVTAGGVPIAGACVTMRDTTTALVVPSRLPGTCSDADGSYRFPVVDAGSYTLTFASPDAGRWNSIPAKAVTVTAGSTTAADADLGAVTATGVTGLITESGTASPLSGMAVTATTTDVDGVVRIVEDVSRADGSFTIDLSTIMLGAAPVVIDVVDPSGAHHPSLGNTVSVQSGYTEAIGVELLPIADAPTVDVKITADDFEGTFGLGEARTFHVDVANVGTIAATDVIARIDPSAILSIDRVAAPPGFSCAMEEGVGVCRSAVLAAGRVVSIEVDVTAVATSFQTIRLGVLTASIDANPSDNEWWGGVYVGPLEADVHAQVDGGPLGAGVPGELTFGAYNTGPAIAHDAWATLDIPEGFVIEGVTSSDWNCIVDGQTVGCSMESLRAGRSASAQVSVIPPDAHETVVLRAAAGTSTSDPELLSNVRFSEVDVVAPISVDLAAHGPFVYGAVEGVPTRLLFGVSNSGPASAGDVVVTTTLPDGGSVASFPTIPDGWSCGSIGPEITCTSESMEPRSSVTFGADIVLSIAGGPFSITTRASTASPDREPGNDAVTDPLVFVARNEADLAVSAGPDSQLVVGVPTSMFVGVSNRSPKSASDVVLTAVLPVGLRATGIEFSFGADCAVDGQDVTCTTDSLPAWSIAGVRVGIVADDLLDGVVTVSATSTTPDPDPTNNIVERTVTAGPVSAELTVYLTGTRIVVGEPSSINTMIYNGGPSVATDVELTYEMPAPLVITGVAAPGWACEMSEHSATCRRDTLPVGGWGVDLAVTGSAPGSAWGAATLTSSTADPDPSGNTSRVPYDVSAAVIDLSTYAYATGTAVAGEPTTVIFGVNSSGTVRARDVRTEVVVTGGHIESVTGTPWACTAAGPGTATCTIDAVLPYNSMSGSLVLVADDPAVDLTVDVTTTTTSTDSYPGNDSARSVSDVLPAGSSDLSVSVQLPEPVVVEGREFSIVAGVSNSGPASTAHDVALVVELPPAVAVVDVEPPSPDWTCSVADLVVTCHVAALARSSSADVTITARPVYLAPFPEVLARVSTSDPDPDPVDDVAKTYLDMHPDEVSLSMSLSGPARGAVGERFTVVGAVYNTRQVAATSVVVELEVPTGMEFVGSAGGSPWSCTADGRIVACSLPTLARFGYASVSLEFVPQEVADDVTFAAEVRSASNDPYPPDNRATHTVDVYPAGSVDLGVVAWPFLPYRHVGATGSFSVGVHSSGPSTPVGDVVLSVNVPEALRIDTVGVQAGVACEQEAQTVTCLLEPLAPGQSISIGIGVTAIAATTLANLTVEVSTTSVDIDTNNDHAAVEFEIVPNEADVSVRVDAPAHLIVGETAIVTASALSSGPGIADRFSMTLEVPESFEIVGVDPLGTCDVSGTRITCDMPAFTWPFQSAALWVEVRAAEAGDDRQFDVAIETSNDPNVENNTASATVDVWPEGSADIAIQTGGFAPRMSSPGQLTVAVTADGPTPATDVELVIDLPPAIGAIDVSSWGSPLTCESTVARVTCTAASYVGFSYVTVGLAALGEASGAVVEVAVTSSSPDPVPTNNDGQWGPFDIVLRPAPPSWIYGAPRQRSIELAWDPSAFATDYVVQFSPDGGATWRTFDDGVSTEPSTVVTGLRTGHTYVVRVAGVNEYGRGEWSSSFGEFVPGYPPRRPGAPKAFKIGDSVRLSWQAPSQRGRNPIVEYVISYSNNGGSWVDLTTTPNTSIVLGPFVPGRHRFRVSAVSITGSSPFSPPSNAVQIR